MDRAALRARLFWQLQPTWHLRRPPQAGELSVMDTVRGLQTLLVAQQGAFLAQTLRHLFAPAPHLEDLERLEIAFYQEGADQRVWRAQITLRDGRCGVFGLIVARAPGASSALTQRDFCHLRALHARQPQYCARPYLGGMLPLAGGVAAYAVEWLEDYKELVFEAACDGGVFLVNAHGAHRRFSPQASRCIWRQIVEVLWWYPELRGVNIQAGDFVGRVVGDEVVAVKLTTARELAPAASLAEHLHAILGSLITASGYLSDGRHPFDRQMPEAVFCRRMEAALRRRFGPHAARLARQQWRLFQQGAFARQEDWLKEDCVHATYTRLRAEHAPEMAWRETCRRWGDYAAAVQAGRLPPSWWFPVSEIPAVLARVGAQLGHAAGPHRGECHGL